MEIQNKSQKEKEENICSALTVSGKVFKNKIQVRGGALGHPK